MGRSLRLVSPLERAIQLKRLDVLRDLAPADLTAIAQHLEERRFARGETVFAAGAPVTRCHIVIDGGIRVRAGDHTGGVVGPQQSLGYLNMLARSGRGLDAVAEVETLTLSLSVDSLYDVFEDNFTILHGHIRQLAARTLEERKAIPDGTYLAPADGLDLPDAGDLDLVERLLNMRRGALGHSNVEALIGLALRSHKLSFPRDHLLWPVSVPSGFLYSIHDGRVRCTLEDGTRFYCGPGYPLGNLESQCGAPRWYEAVTETEVSVLRVETDAFIDTLEHHFEMAIGFLASMATGLLARLAEKREAALLA